MSALPAILIVDDEPRSLEAISMTLEDEFEVHCAGGAEEALAVLDEEFVEAVFCDQRMPGMTGVELLTKLRDARPELPRIIITGYTDPEDIIRAINEGGVHQFITKPWRPEQLLLAARRAVELYRLQREHERLSLELKLLSPPVHARLAQQREALQRGYSFDAIIRAPGSPMDAVCKAAARAAGFDVPALILGETGVGKELLARAIHHASLRADKPFFAVHSAAIPDELLESELFGHRKGAFTDAHANRVGLLEQADGGTVFLDEIGEISPAFQVKLLRFLQEGEIRPVGGNQTRQVDVRVITATNCDLKAEADAGRFREDLYYRLSVACVEAPPLRERPEDVAPLARHLLARLADRHGIAAQDFTPEALERLAAWRWPGNVRELEAEVVRMLIAADAPRLGAELIAPHILHAEPGAAPDPAIEAGLAGEGPLRERVERLEALVLRETLIRHRWNKSRAAEELGLSRVGLRAKLDRYGLEKTETLATETQH